MKSSDLRIRFQFGIAQKLGIVSFGELVPFLHVKVCRVAPFSGLFGTLPLRRHFFFEACVVDGQILLPSHQLSQVQWKTVGVVQLERFFPRNRLFVFCLQVFHNFIEDFDAAIQSAVEAFFFGFYDQRHELMFLFDFRKRLAHNVDDHRN